MSSPEAQQPYSPPPQASPAVAPGQVPPTQPPLYPAETQQQYYAPPAGTPMVDPQQQQFIQPAPGGAPVTYMVTAQVVNGGAPAAQEEAPVIIKGKGLKAMFPQLPFCCFCFPLRHGAIALSAVMMIYLGVCGIIIFTGSVIVSSINGALYGIYMAIGAFYFIMAIFYGYGVAAITKEDLAMVKRYVRGFIGCCIVWFLLDIASLAIQLSYYSRYVRYYSFAWGPWIVMFLIGVIIQAYFCSCLVSYERVLEANNRRKVAIASNDPKAIPMV
ncbi:hypothetical protein BGW42_001108 [Actinomortierella wolfii]|nr:hypothetical protein BGW42_001108 [Actinomortierella wolfii]